MLVLDSTVLIDYLRGRPSARPVRQRAASGEAFATTAINVEEVVRGLRPGEEEAMDALIGALVVLPIGEAEARQAGLWRRGYAARGRTLAQPDCLIGAATRSAGARLATANVKDFPMLGEHVELWPAE